MALQPLTSSVPIVNDDGTPRPEFMRKWSQITTLLNTIPEQIDPGQMLANVGSDAAIAGGVTLSAFLDKTVSAHQGAVLYRSDQLWKSLEHGDAGQVMTSGGPLADLSWQDAAPTVPVLTHNHIFVGDASNVAADVAMSGDATIADTGAVTVVGTHLVDGSAAAPSGSIHAGDTGFFWDSTNSAVGLSISGSEKVSFGGSQTVFSTSGAGYVHKVIGEGTTNNIVEFYGTTAGAARYSCRSARGTIASPAASQQFDEVARWINLGYDGANFQVATRISTFLIEPTPSSTAMGGRMSLYATALGATTNTEVVRIEAAKTNILGPLKIGSISATPDASALLDLQSTTQGFLPPRMTTTQRNAISSPAEGLEVHDTTVKAHFIYQNGAWAQVTTGGSIPTGANPTATASDVAVNGSSSAFMRSDAAPAIQKCSSSQFGLCKVDGTTITESGGVISAVSGGGGGGGANGYLLSPDFGQTIAATGPAFNWAPIWLKAGQVVTGGAMLPRATNAGVVIAFALYGDSGGTASAPGSLLASSNSQTGVTAGSIVKLPFTSAYTVPSDGIYWPTYYLSANLNVGGAVGQGGFHTTGAAYPFPSTAPSNTTATTRSVASY